jgi:hypothetical protein
LEGFDGALELAVAYVALWFVNYIMFLNREGRKYPWADGIRHDFDVKVRHFAERGSESQDCVVLGCSIEYFIYSHLLSDFSTVKQ